MKTFKQYLESLKACDDAIEWAGDKTIEQVVAECHRGDWLLWLANRCGDAGKDMVRITMCIDSRR